jgi:hypothetical protein
MDPSSSENKLRREQLAETAPDIFDYLLVTS